MLAAGSHYVYDTYMNFIQHTEGTLVSLMAGFHKLEVWGAVQHMKIPEQ